MANNIKFVVYGIPRVGSNYFISNINKHPKVLSHYEIFHPNNIYYGFGDKNIDSSQECKFSKAERNNNFTVFMQEIWKSLNKFDAVGYNLFPGHNHKALLDSLNDKSQKKIILKRKNSIDNFISLKIAEQTGQWSSKALKKVEPEKKKIIFREDAFYNHLSRNNAFYQFIEFKLYSTEQNYLIIYYEDFIENKAEILAKVFDFLGVAYDLHELDFQSDKFIKQNKSEILSKIKNPQEYPQKINKIEKKYEYEYVTSFKKKEKNILIFSPVLTYPLSAGNRVRIYNFSKFLQKMGYKIHFVYFTMEGSNNNYIKKMEKTWDSLTVIMQTKKFPIANECNYGVDDLFQNDIKNVVLKICTEKNISIVISNYIFQSKLLEFIPEHILKVLDTHDVFSNRNQLLTKNGIPKEKHWYSFTREEEAKALNRADVVLAIQEAEAKYFSSISNSHVMTLGHFENSKFISRKYNKLQKIGFIGSSNPINAIAINNFISKYIKSDLLSSTKLYIAGNVGNKIEKTHSNIVITGFYEKIEAFYRDMDIIINPLEFGTGLKIKTVEALSFGIPILSTKIGFDGIISHEGYHQIESIDNMIKILIDISNNPDKLENLRKSSEDVFKHFSAKTEKEMLDLLDYKKSLNDKEKISNVYLNSGIVASELNDELCQLSLINFFRNPIKKIEQYKRVMYIYHKFSSKNNK